MNLDLFCSVIFRQLTCEHHPSCTMVFGKEKESAATAAKIGVLEDRMSQMDKMMRTFLGRVLDRIEALESGKKCEKITSQLIKEFCTSQGPLSTDNPNAIGDFKSIEDRLTVLEVDVQNNKDYFEKRITNSIQSIQQVSKQSEKKLEDLHFNFIQVDLKRVEETLDKTTVTFDEQITTMKSDLKIFEEQSKKELMDKEASLRCVLMGL